MISRPHKNQIFIFYATIESVDERDLVTVLSPAEKTRLERFRLKADQERFKYGRWLIKLVLGSVQHIPANTVCIEIDDLGKPFISNDEGLKFSISHTSDMVAVAVSFNRAIGLDIEDLNRTIDLDKISAFLLSDSERIQYQRKDKHQKGAWLIKLWTIKESLAKAIGCGLWQNMNELEIGGIEGDIQIVSPTWNGANLEDWSIENLDLPNDIRASISYQGAKAQTRVFDINEVLIDQIGMSLSANE